MLSYDECERGGGGGGDLLISLDVLMCGLIASSGLMNSIVSLIGLHHSWGWGAGRGKLNQSCRKLLSVVVSYGANGTSSVSRDQPINFTC